MPNRIGRLIKAAMAFAWSAVFGLGWLVKGISAIGGYGGAAEYGIAAVMAGLLLVSVASLFCAVGAARMAADATWQVPGSADGGRAQAADERAIEVAPGWDQAGRG